MDMLLALGLSIGVLIAAWTYIALGVASLPVWAGIVAWGCFFAAGGKTEGLFKTIASNLSGVIWAFLALLVANKVAPNNLAVLSLLVGLIAFAMVMQSRVAALSFIPGAFLGAATAVGAGVSPADSGTLVKPAVALIAGAILGYLSQQLGGALAGSARKPAAAAP